MKKPSKPSTSHLVAQALEVTAERLIAAEAAIRSLADRLAMIDAGADGDQTLADARQVAAAHAKAIR
jgi:hypothetical protein